MPRESGFKCPLNAACFGPLRSQQRCTPDAAGKQVRKRARGPFRISYRILSRTRKHHAVEGTKDSANVACEKVRNALRGAGSMLIACILLETPSLLSRRYLRRPRLLSRATIKHDGEGSVKRGEGEGSGVVVANRIKKPRLVLFQEIHVVVDKANAANGPV